MIPSSSTNDPKLMKSDRLNILLISPFEGSASFIKQLIRNGLYQTSNLQTSQSVSDSIIQPDVQWLSLILLDARSFPGEMEFELDQLRQAAPLVPIIMLSNELTAGQKELYVRKGVQEILDVNSLNAQRLDHTILMALHRHRIREELHSSLDFMDQKVDGFHSQLLGNQMNPHFIFNLMSALQYYILNSQKEKALSFITQFSNLMRKSLDHSREDWITLEDEIEFLKLFVEIQRQRLDFEFQIEFRVDERLDVADYAIPPMLVQPFVENAIIHGMRNKRGVDGKIIIEIKLKKGNIQCRVIDNGDGLKLPRVAEEQAKYGGRKSHALNITRERIALLNKSMRGRQFDMKIMNRKDNAGTLVELCLPIMEY